MKRGIVFLAALAFVSFTATALAGGKPGGYSGITGLYAFQNFDAANAMQEEMDYDNAPGIGFKLGYRFAKPVALEAEYDWFSGFDYEGYPANAGGAIHLTSSTDVSSLMLALKYFPAKTEGKVEPYLLYGIGMMWAERTVTASAPIWGLPASESTSSADGWCMKAGLGLNYYFAEDFSMSVDGAYVWANGDDINTINYFTLGLGANLHF